MRHHSCRDCRALIAWNRGTDAAGRRLGSCGCSGRLWRDAATEKSPNRRPRWKAATRSSQTRESRARAAAAVRLRARRPRFDAVLPVVRAYRELVLACQLAADCEGIPFSAWMRRTLAARAGLVLRRRQYTVPRRVLDLAAAGRLEELEQLAASLAAGEADDSAPTSTSTND